MKLFPTISLSRKLNGPIHKQVGAVVVSLSLIVSGLTLTALVGSQASGVPLNGTRTVNGTVEAFSANAFTAPVGGSWVDVPVASRLYTEDFGSNFDDNVFFYVPAGIRCTENSIVAEGPFLATTDSINGTSKCVDTANNNATYDPISDNPLDPTSNSHIASDPRRGAIPIGFDVNFFGQTYNSLYPAENGTVAFAFPDWTYNRNIAGATNQSKSSAIYPLSLDLAYAAATSNFWVGSTTINEKAAFVISWENIHPCCDYAGSAPQASFQLVLINLGDGDFDAYFNYAKFEIANQGYSAPIVTINMQTGATVGSNTFAVDNMTGFNPGDTCIDMSETFIGVNGKSSFTDTAFADAVDSNQFMKVVSIENRQISLWSDNTCTTAIAPTVPQDVAVGKNVYLQLSQSSDTYRSSAIGWGTYDRITGELSTTELRQNVANGSQIDSATIDGNPSPNRLIVSSYRNEVPGRFVIGQRGGVTIGDPNPDNGIQETSAAPAPIAPSRALSPRPAVPQNVTKGSSVVQLDSGDESHVLTHDVATGSLSVSGEGWSAALSASRPAGKSASVSAPNGDLRVPLSGNLSFNLSGYEPSSQVLVYAMPSGRVVASLTVNKKGLVDYKNVKLPKNLSLSNKFLQINGLSEAGLVRSITLNASMFKRARVVLEQGEEFNKEARAAIRKVLRDAKGERVVRCVAFADLTSQEDVDAKTLKAQEFCDYVTKQDPSLVTKVVVREPFKKRMNNRVALRLRG
jgi:hypothetical protein